MAGTLRLKFRLGILPHVLPGAIIGAFLGAWISAWPVLVLVAEAKGWFYRNLGLSPSQLIQIGFSGKKILGGFWKDLHVPLPSDPGSLVVLCTMFGLILGVFIGALWTLFRPDPGGLALKSLRWSLRSLFTWPVLALCGVVSGILVISQFLSTVDWLQLVLMFLFLALLFWTPIAVVRESVLSGRRARSWWNFDWPGFRVLLMFLGLGLLDFIIGLTDAVVPEDKILLRVTFSIGSVLVGLLIFFLQVSVLLLRKPWRAIFNQTLHWKIIGPWVSLNLWITLGVLLFVGPFLALLIYIIFFLPYDIGWLEHWGFLLPRSLRLLVISYNWLKVNWHVFILPLSIFCWFWAGRLLWLLLGKGQSKIDSQPIAVPV